MRISEIISEGRLDELAPSSNPGNGGNYLQALASAWYNGTFNTGNLHRGIKSQEDVERILDRGIHCGDGKVRKYNIDYNANHDGVEIQSHDHYEYSDYDDAGNEIDDRTGQPWGPYDVVTFHGNELTEGVDQGLAAAELAEAKRKRKKTKSKRRSASPNRSPVPRFYGAWGFGGDGESEGGGE